MMEEQVQSLQRELVSKSIGGGDCVHQ
uniref:Uncharacterized protein n=1 Tax=Anguilla anguilla TaxID=7936 RepID=A0A0E9TMN9_ANGAN